MKTYIVSVWYELYGRVKVKIIYAGQDEYKAFNTDVSEYASADIEVWESGNKKESYIRVYETGKWRLKSRYEDEAIY